MILSRFFLFLAFCQADIFSSKNLQTLVSGFTKPKDLKKAKLVDKNWIDAENVYTRISPEAGLFKHRGTNKIILETKQKSWSHFELAQELSRKENKRIMFQNLMEEQEWSEMVFKLAMFKRGNQASVDILDALAGIVDINARDSNGATALDANAIVGRVDLLEILLKHGAQINGQREDVLLNMNTPLMLATWCGHSHYLKVLLGYGANPNLKNQSGRTALHWAAHKGNLNVIKMLLNHNADIDAMTNSFRTPLIEAISEDHCDCVEFLLIERANRTHRVNDQIRRIHAQCRKCELLLQNPNLVAERRKCFELEERYRSKSARQERMIFKLEAKLEGAKLCAYLEHQKNVELEKTSSAQESVILQLRAELEARSKNIQKNRSFFKRYQNILAFSMFLIIVSFLVLFSS